MRYGLWVAPALVFALFVSVGHTQEGLNSKGNEPIEIEADDGIEWIRDAKAYIARGNAKASRGGLSVLADMLTAHYRVHVDGANQKIFRIEANGSVKIISAAERAFGDNAVYHMDEAVIVLQGKSLRFETTDATITARDSLEYWQNMQLAVARGEAIAIQGEYRLKADILSAHFTNNISGTSNVEQIDAFGKVHISTPSEIARGNEGVYNPSSGIATLCGNVRITRGDSQLNGECAEVNLKTGISRLMGGTGRVKGLISTTGGL